MAQTAEHKKSTMQNFLDVVERVGNKVPHPVLIFVILIGAVVILSHIFYIFDIHVAYQVVNPETHKIENASATARSLLTAEGIRFMFTGFVQNFMNFNAVGIIIVAMLGVGVAEEAGLVNALIRKLVAVTPPGALTYVLVFVGILSSIAADAGYLVLIPLAAAAFISVGRHPLAGLAMAFAAVASAFLVNILIVPVDGVLTEITNDAIHIINPSISIDLTANIWFSIASVFLLTVLITIVTEKVVEPRLGVYGGDYTLEGESQFSEAEGRGLKFAFYGLLGVILLMLLLTLPSWAPLRNPDTGSLISNSPFMNSLIVTIALLFLTTGVCYGIGAGSMTKASEAIAAMTKVIGSLSGLILLLLVISQFLAYFNYTNMATLAAVSLARMLQQADLSAIWLLLGFIAVVFILDLIITGAIPKWAIFAPIFVPLLMKLGVAPEAVLAAYRVADSPMNAITPLNAYFAMIVVFAQKYQKDAGVGTIIALMLPYIGALCVIWTLLFAAWHLLGIPWGL